MAILNKRRSTNQLPQLQQRSIYEPFVNLEAGERGREILRPSGVQDRGNLSTRPVTSVVQGERPPSLGGVGRQPSLGGGASRPVTSTTSGALAPRTSITSTGTGASKPAATTAKPSITSKTTAAKPAISSKPTTPASKTQVTPTAKPVVKKSTGTTNKLGTALTGAALGATTKAVIDKITGSKKTPDVKPPVVKPPGTPKPPVVKPPGTPKPPITSIVNKPNIGTPPFVPPKTTVKPPIMGGGTGVKPGGGSPTLKPPVVKPPVTPKTGATPKTAGQIKAENPTLTDEEVQAELDRVRAEIESNVVPEGAVTNEDGSYSVTENGMINTYDKDGNIIGMEAVTDTTVGGDGEDTVVAGDGTDTTSGLTRSLTGGTGDTTLVGEDTSGMTDLGEGYFADASGNIYGADGNLMYTVGDDGEYVDANDSGATATVDETVYTDPVTGEVYNLGEDGNWTLEGGDSFTEDVTSWTDPETGLTWNEGADGEWTQEGFDGTVDDITVGDDTVVDDESSYVPPVEEEDDGTNYEEDAKGGSIVKKYKRNARRFENGGLNSIYSDTDEEVQDFQNVGYNYGEFDDPSMTGDQSLYSQSQPFQNTYLRSGLPSVNVDGYIPSPEGWPEGYVDNGDGTATYVDDDGSTITIDADTNIVFTTDADGNVFNPEVGESVSGTYPNERGESVSGTYLNERGESVSGDYLDERGESVSGNYPVEGITSSGSGNKPSFLAQQERDESVSGRYDQPYQNQTGILDSLLNAVRDNPSLAGGAVGALIASLMDQAGDSESASPSQPVDISELTSFDPRTTDFGAGMVGGRTGTGSPIVSYADYAEDVGDEIIDDRLYSDLGISGYLREPDMNNYRDEEGNLTDQSGNLVDEYGYLLEDGGYEEEPQEEYMAEDMAEEEPAMAGGGTTHYTFGRVMNPAENLGIGMKKGGLSQAHTVHSHHTNPVVNNRVDFRKGSAVNGAGDGQSDDIPAWLADGEYVMDAELVSMLGNGSNKAGAKILDKFRENIRAHKRGAPLGKIPPKAKSPLNYLKESMNG